MNDFSRENPVPIAPLPIEKPAQKLDLKYYRKWNEALRKLQFGEKLSDTDHDTSSDLGQMAANLGEKTALLLSEHSPSILDKYHGIAMEDEVPDEYVIQESTQLERINYFAQAFISNIQDHGISDESTAANYVSAAMTIGTAITGLSFDQIKNKLISTAAKNKIYQTKKINLIQALNKISENDPNYKKLTSYLIENQTTVDPQPATDMEIDIRQLVENNGLEFYRTENTPKTYTLSNEDKEFIKPLLIAQKHGRIDMIEQAKETIYQLFPDVNRGSLNNYNPPKWWINAESLQRLKSNQILICLPPTDNINYPKNAPLLNYIYEASGKNSGWFMVEIAPESGNVLSSSHLHN